MLKTVWRSLLLTMAALALFLVGARGAMAIPIEPVNSELHGSLDTTITMGAAMRVEDRNPGLIGINNARFNHGKASAYSINADNGNLNYGRWDLTSLSARVTHELQLDWRNLGFFGRAYYFYDTAVMDIGGDRTHFTNSARRRAGWDFELLDYYLNADVEVLDRPVNIRIGSQVLNWGESTFIQNGINVINPVDVTQLRVAGAELRDALLPIPAIDLNVAITDQLSVEGFYQLYWENTEVEPMGTYFSTSDLVGPGGYVVYLGFGLPPIPHDVPPWFPGCGFPENRNNPNCQPPSSTPTGLAVPRGRDNKPSHQGQGGIAVRYFAPELRDTEFGLYWTHFHSRLPVLSGRSGDLQDFIFGDYASSGSYFREFPENIDSFGASFNTEVGPPGLGIAIQGEASFKPNQPLQVDDVELLFSALSPIDPFVAGSAVGPDGKPVGLPIFGRSQLGSVEPLTYIRGYRRRSVFQWQYTVTALLGPTLGTDQMVFLGEMGGTWVPNLQPESELRYEGPGTFTSGNPFFTETYLTNVKRTIQPATTTDGFADEFSWGYRLVWRGDLLNAVGPVNLFPILAFQHDVQGTTPSPILNFVDDRKTVTVRLDATYLGRWSASLAYTNYFDGKDFNLINDRDFVSLAASYSF